MKKFKSKKGSTLALVLLVAASLTILSTGLLMISRAENVFAARQEDRQQAYYLARSGAQAVAEYIVNDPNGDAASIIGKDFSAENTQMSSGSFRVKVELQPGNVKVITGIGTYNGISQEAKVMIDEAVGGIFDFVIAARDAVYFNQGSGTGNGNSGPTLGYEYPNDLGDIVVAQPSGPQISDKVQAVKGIPPDTIQTPAVVHYDEDLTFPEINPPDTYDDDLGAVYTTKSNESVVINTGGATLHVHADSIYMKNSALQITGSGIVHLYVDGSIYLDTQSRFDVDPDAKLYIYVMGDEDVTLKGRGAQNNIFLYAPDSDVEWNNAQHNDFFGSIVGKTVTLHNQLVIRYNQELPPNAEIDTTVSGLIWID